MERVDMDKSPRAEAFRFFSGAADPFASVSFAADVTAARAYAKRHGLSFYMVMVYLITQSVNAVESLRLAFDGEDVVRLDARVPSFTDLHPGAEQFHIVTLPVTGEMNDWCRRAKAQSRAQTAFIDPGKEGDHLIYLSALPWLELTGLVNDFTHSRNDSVPRITWGRWTEQAGRTLLSLTVEFNHRLADGLHIGRFAGELASRIAALTEEGETTV